MELLIYYQNEDSFILSSFFVLHLNLGLMIKYNRNGGLCMHMADALLSPSVAGVMALGSCSVAGYSIYKLSKEDNDKMIPVMGVMGAFVFATQMINFTIPGTGSSGHLCGGLLLSAILGPYASFLTMISVLAIQCLMFADGGLMALGANIWNMAFYGCFLGALIWKMSGKSGLSKRKIMITSILGSVITLQLGAFSVSVETFLSGITQLPFSVFLMAMLPIHLAIGFVEGLITGCVLIFVFETRSTLLWCVNNNENTIEKLSFKTIVKIMLVVSLVVAGVVSLFASSLPDGLEWSIQRLTGSTEIEGTSTVISSVSESIQKLTSILPDYNFSCSESGAGTSVSGLIGALVVLLFVVVLSTMIRKWVHRNESNTSSH